MKWVYVRIEFVIEIYEPDFSTMDCCHGTLGVCQRWIRWYVWANCSCVPRSLESSIRVSSGRCPVGFCQHRTGPKARNLFSPRSLRAHSTERIALDFRFSQMPRSPRSFSFPVWSLITLNVLLQKTPQFRWPKTCDLLQSYPQKEATYRKRRKGPNCWEQVTRARQCSSSSSTTAVMAGAPHSLSWAKRTHQQVPRNLQGISLLNYPNVCLIWSGYSYLWVQLNASHLILQSDSLEFTLLWWAELPQ